MRAGDQPVEGSGTSSGGDSDSLGCAAFWNTRLDDASNQMHRRMDRPLRAAQVHPPWLQWSHRLLIDRELRARLLLKRTAHGATLTCRCRNLETMHDRYVPTFYMRALRIIWPLLCWCWCWLLLRVSHRPYNQGQLCAVDTTSEHDFFCPCLLLFLLRA